MKQKSGFRAYVQVYDETYYVDTESGEGVDKVVKKMSGLLSRLANKIYINSFSKEDIVSELNILLMEGLYNFEPNRDVKLSTFLQTHLQNKIISRIKSENQLSNDATLLFDKPNKIDFRKTKSEICFSQVGTNDEEDPTFFENNIPEGGGFKTNCITDYDLINFETSLDKFTSQLDTKTKNMVELIYYEGYSTIEAAEKAGLSGWAGCMRIKKLADKPGFKNLFSKQDWEEVSKDFSSIKK